MKTHVIIFEGLSPWLFPVHATYIQHGLLPRLPQSKITVHVCGWAWGKPDLSKIKEGDQIIVVCHSFGCPTAIAWMKQFAKKIKMAIFLDARLSGQPYMKPENVEIAHNFFQLGLFKGYPVKGAIPHGPLVGVAHGALPYLEEPEKLIEAIL
jgi:pimeloyl-ACP methyl ester carboxylesterase